ncbi:MAG: uroporphyrinogen-III decarboxylase [Thermoleophilia bacterium]|nr:uroporphyrinogen-III decarboxylase [Thermoleophilia bacterium]
MGDMTGLLEQRRRLLRDTVALRQTQRVPVVPLANAFTVKVVGVSLKDFCADPVLAYETIIQGLTSLGEIDATQQPGYSPWLLQLLWNSRVKVPGVDLPDDTLWQVEELELITPEDYDTIIDGGYGAFLERFYAETLGDPLVKVGPYMESAPAAVAAWEAKGLPVLASGVVTIPFEALCGGRSLRAFVLDLIRMPDRVQAAMDAMMPAMIEGARGMLRAFPTAMGVWVGGWRTASQFLSPTLWERFVFPYYTTMVDVVLEEGGIPVLHFDANWNRDLERLRELPAKKCILSTDGATNIRRAKELLGDRMCLMGDTPAPLLTLGTPDEVYDYASALIRDLGPTGFILSSGCDIPYSAQIENVRALIAAAND